MQKMLNIPLISQKAEKLGLNQTEIADKLGVSREAVSKWFNREFLPRPAKLLKLGRLLKLSYEQMILKEAESEPIVAFRKVGNAKTTEIHIKRAKETGYALKKMVRYLPFDRITLPPQLNKPVNDYDYIQEAVTAVRKNLKINDTLVEVKDIIDCFNSYKTILIPVLLGAKKNHQNALHIRLPESSTNWVFINLDTKVFDFKFWLVHELGHIYTPNLKGDEAENFNDNFAGAFLFPKEIAQKTYYQLFNIKENDTRIEIIFQLAKDYVISPYNVLREVNKYANNINEKEISLGKEFFARYTKFVNSYNIMSESIFKKSEPKVEEYIKTTEKEFNTIFYSTLKKCLEKDKLAPSYIKSILNVSVADAKEIYNYLLHGTKKNTS